MARLVKNLPVTPKNKPLLYPTGEWVTAGVFFDSEEGGANPTKPIELKAIWINGIPQEVLKQTQALQLSCYQGHTATSTAILGKYGWRRLSSRIVTRCLLVL